ncbi:MAG: cytochrome P450 [Ilumatobacter sp.]
MTFIDLSTYDPMDPAIQQCPYPHYGAVRDDGPLFWHERSAMFFAARHDTVKQILRDTQTFSSVGSNAKNVGSDAVMAEVAEIMKQGWPRAETMLTVDPPIHTSYRRLVSQAFSARRIAQLEDRVRAIAVDLIDRFPERGTIDFHRDFAVSLPVQVIHFALNMSDDVIDKIKAWSDAANVALGTDPSDEDRIAAAHLAVEGQRYWYDEYQERLARPTDDILSEIAHADYSPPGAAEGDTRKLEFPEVYSIVKQLMVAGNETTTKFLNETMRLLIENPAQWEALSADRDGVVRDLVEEGLRMSSPNQGLFRYATIDTQIEGVRIPAGSKLWLMFGAANRDDAVFSDSETFDASRERLNEHLAFGMGRHFCIGAPLSRLEGTVAFDELAKRLHLPAFASENSFEYEPSYVLRGLVQLDLVIEKR